MSEIQNHSIAEIQDHSIDKIESQEPLRFQTSDVLIDVVKAMCQVNKGNVLIESASGKLEGIFCESDVYKRVDHKSLKWHQIPVGDVMTTKLFTISKDETIAHAIDMMQEYKFRHLPIVNGDMHATAVISVREIIDYIASFFPEHFLNLPPSPKHEAHDLYGG